MLNQVLLYLYSAESLDVEGEHLELLLLDYVVLLFFELRDHLGRSAYFEAAVALVVHVEVPQIGGIRVYIELPGECSRVNVEYHQVVVVNVVALVVDHAHEV